ncbi:MAG: PDZ domain-containing protein [Gammaproteobacteria bacterium]
MQTKILLVVVLCLGVFAGYYFSRGTVIDQSAPNANTPSGVPEIAHQRNDNPNDTIALQQRLAQAEQLQLSLAERVSDLEAVIGKLGTFPAVGAGTHESETIEESEHTAPAQTFRASVEALIETGIPAEQAALIQARLDEFDLNQLYIKDRASREGWLNTARYRNEQRQAQNAYQELRSEIGDDAYDRMLYALGQANRVVVRDIMQNSSAEQYGLQANDRVYEYDGQRVFTGQELNELVTQGGDAGALVLVRVQRDEQQLDVYLPRGPIGIRLASSRELP